MSGGRPTDYREEYPEQARKLCLLGATDKELAGFFDVAESTINKWKLEHPEFSESLKEGKAQADARVAESLFHRALAYEHASEEIKIVGGEVERVAVTKKYPPDTAAAIFWLKNRTKNTANPWKDKVEHSGDPDNPLVPVLNVSLHDRSGTEPEAG